MEVKLPLTPFTAERESLNCSVKQCELNLKTLAMFPDTAMENMSVAQSQKGPYRSGVG